MIEHVRYADGRNMLDECFRVLKPGGKIRLSTPDLAFLIDMHTEKLSSLQERYIKHSTDIYIKNAPSYEATFVINNFVRNWSHQFIYDEKVLTDLMKEVGFVNTTRYAITQSEDVNMRNLENTKRMPYEFLDLESMVLESTKPQSNALRN